MSLQKAHNLWPSRCFWTSKKVIITFALSNEKFLCKASMLSCDCRIFENGRSNKILGTSDYCCREEIVCVLESILCKVLLSFDNSRLIDSALVFLVPCKLGPKHNPLFRHLARRHLIIRYFCLLISDKSAFL